MKAKSKNNPIVVGALLCILVGSIAMTIQQMRRDNGPAAPVTQTAAVPAGTATVEPVPLEPEPPVRDPFSPPALRRPRAQAAVGAQRPARPPLRPGPAPASLPVLTTRPLPVSQRSPQNLSVPPTGSAAIKPDAAPVRSEPPAAAASTEDLERSLVEKLRLTAVIDGPQRSAVIEGAGPQPRTVRVGDHVATLQIAAVNAQEVVLVGRNGLWTLPLMSSSAPSSDPAPQEAADAPH
ncbi:MAG TPA: hypothetical protein VFB38_15600 [Chthonomonadaceae bacterium]|nr:hypothetical protein [Chthonomonadaceae bacterium]